MVVCMGPALHVLQDELFSFHILAQTAPFDTRPNMDNFFQLNNFWCEKQKDFFQNKLQKISTYHNATITRCHVSFKMFGVCQQYFYL